MKLELFIEACTALWGPRWQTEAASAFDVSDRTIRRIVAGDVAIGGGFAQELGTLIAARQNHLTDLAIRVEAAAPRPEG